MPLKRTPIRRRSRAEGARLRRYQQARGIVYERCGGHCEAGTPWCNGRCEQVHHRKGRDGDLVDRVDLLLGTCEPCHRYMHSNPAISYERGWMVRRLGESDD